MVHLIPLISENMNGIYSLGLLEPNSKPNARESGSMVNGFTEVASLVIENDC